MNEVVAPNPMTSSNHYGYGDAAPDEKAYYEHAATQRMRVPRRSSMKSGTEKCQLNVRDPMRQVNDSEYYGYGDGAPDSAAKMYGYGDFGSQYGYGEGAPDSATASKTTTTAATAAAPDEADKYGYGDGAPDSARKSQRRKSSRRSSMKSGTERCPIYSESDPMGNIDASARYGYGDATPDYRGRGDYSNYGEAAADYRGRSPQTSRSPGGRRSTTGGKRRSGKRRSKDKNSESMKKLVDALPPVDLGQTRKYSMPRRSSLKKPGAPRRASIQFGGTIEVNLPGSSRPVKRRTSIEFKTHQTDFIPGNRIEDVQKAWIQQDEYSQIKKNNKKIAKGVRNGLDKNFCLRGLEAMLTKKSKEKRKVDRESAASAVLSEQTQQRSQKIFDEDRISEKYMYVCLQNKLQAQERGENDEAEVEGYLRSTRRMLRRMSV